MSTKNKQDLKQEFLSGSKITQAKLENLIDSSVNKVDDLSIDANGNVGIGTTSPSENEKLTVNGNAKIGTIGQTLKIGDLGQPNWAGIAHIDSVDKDNYALLQDSNGRTILNSKSDQLLSFHQGNIEKMVIKNGNVGIGTTPSTGVKLEVDGNTSLNGTLEVTGNTTIEGILNAKGTNSYFNGKVGIGLQPTHDDYTPNINLAIGDHDTGLNQVGDGVLTILTNGSERLRIDQEGNVGIGTTPSAGVKLEVSGDIKCTNLTIQESIQSPLFDAHTIFEEVSYDTNSWKSQISINFPAGSKLIHHIHVSNNTASDDSDLHSWEIKKGTGAYTQWKTIKQFFNSDGDHQHRSASFIETITSNTTINRWQIDPTSTPDGNDFISWVIQVVPNGQGT